jgi:hypothetical protein
MIYDGIIISPGAMVHVSDDSLFISPFFEKRKKNVKYEEIQRVVYSLPYLKIQMKCQQSITFLSWRTKKMVSLLSNKGILCESFKKNIHSPLESTYSFWHFH